ncbi:Holliday junction DNA helicase subunit RuvA [Desulfotomaculum arcticum]|uniref:Holliday junction branch migration complex subunit RuvA n=1 Tax=Desulfotruncus arcticus DSM 17038 TaxID=1121424 RepID=A0A1I2SET5_9FIRM|nr:Holliday junction branch migration protein RuvA [Desulfotruncus arcticus]SFG51345.1 Holliday junction DNA helicase subunit RuvA [Desulfotomaculum arcticum] [Desulfotruncus arcticus DSM 17038]
MIAFLKGKVFTVEQDTVIIDVNGVGYRVNVTANCAASLQRKDSEVLIHTHMIVREDDMQLYGFQTPEEIAVFMLLLGVNGIGPRAALSILAHMKPEGIGRALALEDMTSFTRIPGIGKKTAQRIILELKDKFKKINIAIGETEEAVGGEVNAGLFNDTAEALMMLGYGAVEAREAANKACVDSTLAVADAVKLSLRYLDNKRNK